jgi:hypothetical protein
MEDGGKLRHNGKQQQQRASVCEKMCAERCGKKRGGKRTTDFKSIALFPNIKVFLLADVKILNSTRAYVGITN